MNFQLPHWVRPGIFVFLFACLLTTLGINRFDLRESTEPREAGIAADMLQNSQFLVPTLNGRPFLEKPPLSYWLQAGAIKLFGYEAFAPRLPSALAGIATVGLLIFFFRRSQEKEKLILLSGFLLISMASFWGYARTAGQDILLAFGVALALLAFYFTREQTGKALWWLYALGIAIATMTKGVIGLAVPGVVIFCFLMMETLYLDKRFVFSQWLYAAIFALIGLLPLLSWLAVLYSSQGADSVKEVMWTNSVGRFQGEYAYGAHAEPFYFYLRKLPETYQPWSLLLYAAVIFAIKTLRQNKRVLFFLCWFIAPYVLLSMSSGKRPSYVLMLYPAAAVLLAQVIVLLTQTPNQRAERAKVIKGLWVVQAVLFSIIPVFVAARLHKAHAPVAAALVLILGLLCVGWLWRAVKTQQLFHGLLASAGIILLSYSSYFSFFVPHDDQKQSAKRVMQQLDSFVQAGRPVALYKPTERMEGAVSFYLQRRVPVYRDLAVLQAALVEQPSTVILTAEEKDLNLAEFKDEAQIRYASIQYHYISSK
ncbi:MAG TPA: glycosyltransferase family 39 protein [Pseudomonadales bacterium]|nr:glycosyltransferase family 39 protein [Pseudomonadales bacterium]